MRSIVNTGSSGAFAGRGRSSAIFAVARSRAGAVVLALTLVGATLRFATLGQQSYWYDEAITASLLDGSLLDVFRGIVDTESTPPLYYVVGWLWAHVFGTGELGLRSLSAVVGTLVVPVAFAAGRVVSTARIGVAAAALAAVSPMLIWYSQEARAYSLLTFLGGASFVLFALARSDPSPRSLTWWAVVSALAVATHYFAAFVVLAEAVLLLRAQRGLRRVRWAAGALAAFALCLLPLAAVQASHRRLGWVGGIDLGERLTEALQRLVTAAQPSSWAGATGARVTPYAWIGASVVLGLAGALVVSRASQRERKGALLALKVAAFGIGAPVSMAIAADLLAHGDGDYFLDRNVLGAWVPLAVFVAAGLAARRAGVLGAACLAGLVCWSIGVHIGVVTSPELQRDDWRAVASALDDERPTSVVVYPAYQAAALERQRRDLSRQDGSERVERIVVVLTGFTKPPATFRVPNGFAQTSSEHVQHFVLVELEAPDALPVGPGDIAEPPLKDADLALLVRREPGIG